MALPRIAVLAALVLTVVAASAAFAQSTDEASKPPDQILADVKRDLAAVKSFHLTASFVDKNGRTSLTGDVFASGPVRMRFTIGKLRFRVLKTRNGIYLYGNRAYWKAAGASERIARKLQNRWAKVPASATKDLDAELDGLTPKALAACSTSNIGTLKTEGTSTLDGQKVIVISDAGDKPGSSPGRAYVAAEGPVLPLRLTQTGPAKAGGTPDPGCSEADTETKSSDARLSKFDKAPAVRAPKHALITSR